MKRVYWFEVTDTFGGEANYCWVRHYIVHARSITGAVRRVNREEGYAKLRRVFDCGGEVHWVPDHCCVKLFGSEMDEQAYASMRGNARELP